MRIESEVAEGPYEAEVLEGGPELFDELRESWTALCREGPCDEPFFGPSWIRAHAMAFEEPPFLFAVARSQGRVRAILPMKQLRTVFAGTPMRLLRGMSSVHSCRFGLIHGAGDEREAARAVWGAIRERGGFDLLRLSAVPDGSGAEHILAAASEEGHLTEKELNLRTPYLTLPGSLEELLAGTDGKFRSNMRRRNKKLEARGPVKLERQTAYDQASLERFLALEKAGWKGEEGTAIACDPATRRFYEEVATAGTSEGWFTLFHLTCGNEDVASHFGVTWKGRYFLPKPAYHEGFKDCSPGQLMVQAVLSDCFDRKLTEFDFLGPMMDWKSDWAPRERHHFYHYVYRKGVVGTMLHAAKFKLRRVDAERRGRGL